MKSNKARRRCALIETRGSRQSGLQVVIDGRDKILQLGNGSLCALNCVGKGLAIGLVFDGLQIDLNVQLRRTDCRNQQLGGDSSICDEVRVAVHVKRLKGFDEIH